MQVFFGVCLYGLYHGLIFLPVVLSLVGPKPYAKDPSKLFHEAADEPADASAGAGLDQTLSVRVPTEHDQFMRQQAFVAEAPTVRCKEEIVITTDDGDENPQQRVSEDYLDDRTKSSNHILLNYNEHYDMFVNVPVEEDTYYPSKKKRNSHTD